MNNRKAFTIVELLTSVIIIALLLGILLPSISMVRTKSKETAQKAQFATIDMALEAFKQDYGDYPPSDRYEGTGSGLIYCGAQKLTEALLGWDLAGFHPKTVWRRDGLDASGGITTYDPLRADLIDPTRTLKERRGPYLEVAKTLVFRLGASSATANDGLYKYAEPNFVASFDHTLPNYVICDAFGVKKLLIPHGTQMVTATAGTPILYYKANTSYKVLTCYPPKAPESIYNFFDNQALVSIGVLPNLTGSHSLAAFNRFCDQGYKVWDSRVPPISATRSWPNRPDTYILISAGADHEFGTNDDILNF
jgi:type II secretory pathway pseudopilin PulG